LLQIPEFETDDGSRLESLVGKLVHWGAKQPVEPRRTELDREHIEVAAQHQLGAWLCARPDHDGTGHDLRRGRIPDADDVWVLQIEFEKLVGPSSDWVYRPRPGNMRATLLKAANAVS
jgi:hypothetical protein